MYSHIHEPLTNDKLMIAFLYRLKAKSLTNGFYTYYHSHFNKGGVNKCIHVCVCYMDYVVSFRNCIKYLLKIDSAGGDRGQLVQSDFSI